MNSYFKQYSWQRDALISGGVVLAFAFFGPFGTYGDMGFAMRLFFWTIAIFGCGAIFWAVVFLSSRVTIIKNSKPFIRHVTIIFITSFPSAFLIYFINLIFRNIVFPPERWAWLWFTVFVIGMIITGLIFFSNLGKSLSKKENHKKEVLKIQITTDSDILQFLARLPKAIGTDLVSLSMSDHYIDVTTKQGGAMVHLKFSKAMKELKNYPGLQVHRSHWVSFSAIKNAKLTGRDKSVELFDERNLPVSDKYKNDVQKALN